MKLALLLLAASLTFGSCSSAVETTTTPIVKERIGNARTKQFHMPSCRFVKDIIEKVNFESREAALAAGYDPDESSSGCKP